MTSPCLLSPFLFPSVLLMSSQQMHILYPPVEGSHKTSQPFVLPSSVFFVSVIFVPRESSVVDVQVAKHTRGSFVWPKSLKSNVYDCPLYPFEKLEANIALPRYEVFLA